MAVTIAAGCGAKGTTLCLYAAALDYPPVADQRTPADEKATDAFVKSNASAVVQELAVPQTSVTPHLIPGSIIGGVGRARRGSDRVIELASEVFVRHWAARDPDQAWAIRGIIAHEIGHQLLGHPAMGQLSDPEQVKIELAADRFSGSTLYRLGATLDEAVAGPFAFASERDASTHGTREQRIESVVAGWKDARLVDERPLRQYGESMQRVATAVARNEIAVARKLLLDTLPALGETDLRGFEWYIYWRRLFGAGQPLFARQEWVGPDGYLNGGAISISPNGLRIAAIYLNPDYVHTNDPADSLVVWDRLTGTVVQRWSGDFAGTVAWLSDSTLLTGTGSQCSHPAILEAFRIDGTRSRYPCPDGEFVARVAVAPGLDRMIVVDDSGIQLWSITDPQQLDRQPLTRLSDGTFIKACTWAPDHDVYVAIYDDVESSGTLLAFTLNAECSAFVLRDELAIGNVAAATLLCDETRVLVVSNAGELLVVHSSEDRLVRGSSVVIAGETRMVKQAQRWPGHSDSILVASEGAIEQVHTESGRIMRRWEGHGFRVSAFDVVDNYIASIDSPFAGFTLGSDDDGSAVIRLMTTADASESFLPLHDEPLDKPSQRILSVGGTVAFIGADLGAALNVSVGGKEAWQVGAGTVSAFTISLDGRYLLAIAESGERYGDEQRISIIDVATQRVIATSRVLQIRVQDICTLDATQIAIVRDDGIVWTSLADLLRDPSLAGIEPGLPLSFTGLDCKLVGSDARTGLVAIRVDSADGSSRLIVVDRNGIRVERAKRTVEDIVGTVFMDTNGSTRLIAIDIGGAVNAIEPDARVRDHIYRTQVNYLSCMSPVTSSGRFALGSWGSNPLTVVDARSGLQLGALQAPGFEPRTIDLDEAEGRLVAFGGNPVTRAEERWGGAWEPFMFLVGQKGAGAGISSHTLLRALAGAVQSEGLAAAPLPRDVIVGWARGFAADEPTRVRQSLWESEIERWSLNHPR